MTEEITKQNTLVPDAVAGLTTGIANIPDAMASAILAGVNPFFGLYALMVGTPVGALLTSSNFMLICTTSAMALTAGVGPRVKEQLDLTETTQDVFGEEAIFPSTEIIGDSTKAALVAANAWLEQAADQEVNNK